MGTLSGSERVKRPEAQHEIPEPMRVWLLGGFRVSVGSRTVEGDAWHLRKATALVKVLALAPDHRLHREQLMNLLWPDLGKKAASNNLRYALHGARKTLASDPGMGSRYLASEDESLGLCPEGSVWVDADAFEEAAATARHSRTPAAYRAAIHLYPGELLPEDRYDQWAETRRQELRSVFHSLLLELAELYEERGEYEAGIEALERAVSEEPTNEEPHAGLMRLYALSGKQQGALAQYERLRDVLHGHLGKEPSLTTQALHHEIVAGRFPPTRAAPAPPEEPPEAAKHNLPAARTKFVGREREMVELKRMLAMTNLLTLTGTGGCGKTRLALEVGRDLVGTYPDGVWMVELAGLSEGTLVPQALATTLGVREQPGRPFLESLLNTLSDKEMLVVLDNCEHLIDATSHLAEALLNSCPSVRVLSTSREPLGMTDELNWLVPSLSAPGVRQSPTMEELEGYESARLFVDRASKRHPGFALTPENTQAVGRVCARLEGIPLAIELAAARVGVLSAEQISERLGHSLTLLTGGYRTAEDRHQTLRAALDWSFDLLSEPEQALFRRLSVFAGGFTLEAAESVVGGGGIEQEDVLDLLGGLVEKSLVVAEESWERGARYRLLEPIRQYAQEKLEQGEEEHQTRYRHAEWYLTLAEEADKESSGPGHARWLHRLETEHDNLRAALDWSLEEGDAELSSRLAGALWLFWFTRGYSTEGWGWLEKAISLGGSPAARAKALTGAGWIIMFHDDFATAKTRLEESLALYREVEDQEGIASSLNFLGYVGLLGGRDDIPLADLLEEALALKPRIKNRRTIANTLVFAGLDALRRGEWDSAVARHEEALALYREIEDTWGITIGLMNLGLMLVAMEHLARGAALLRELMHVSRELDDKLANQYSFFGLACVADSEGRTARAARLWGVSEAIRDLAGIQLPPLASSVMRYESRLTGARDRLGEAAFDEAWLEGKSMTPDEAAEYALSEEKSAPPTPRKPEEPLLSGPLSKLTRRETEVGMLVAKELTNRQIASELMLSEHTVATHIRNILKKLGLHSRTQITAWFTEHRPSP
jgi:predicted ATPase/DNA-binding SARP family transcriptional activator/DNA-binding CsgD family transcriptional regulator